jgi:hypothetical protein
MPLFFSFLAAITFPHTIVMGMMKHKNGWIERVLNMIENSKFVL